MIIRAHITTTAPIIQWFTNAIQGYIGQRVAIEIRPAGKKRSNQANAYYWAVIVPHVRNFRLEQGDPVSIEQVHEDLLQDYSPTTTGRRLSGAGYIRPLRSSEMSVQQMNDYITAITATMAQMGAPVPMEGL